jgi:hypothetical protein
MNYKLQLSPTSSKSSVPLPVAERRGAPPPNWDDVKFLRSWLVYDSDLENTRTQGHLNWNMIVGLALTAVVSAGGWAGVVLLVRHFVK